MAQGDVVSGLSSVAVAGYLDVQPPAGVTWVITNIYHEDAAELYLYDGTNSLLFDSAAAGGVWYNLQLHVTNSIRVRVKNTHATLAKLIGYDGVVFTSA